MSLIIFNKRQEITFQRFALSVFAGATILLCLGVLHSVLHHMPHTLELGAPVEGRLLLLAAGVGIILAIIYFDQLGPSAWSEVTIAEHKNKNITPPSGYERAADIRKLFAYIIAADTLVFGIGLYGLVWLQVMHGVDLILALGTLALSSIAVFLPLHYAALLRLDVCTENVSDELCAFAEQRFGKILYWVLVVYWACLFASYLILLVYSRAYCHFLVC